MSQFLKNEQDGVKNSLNTSSLNETKESLISTFNQFDIMKIQTMDSINMENLRTSLISNYWHL